MLITDVLDLIGSALHCMLSFGAAGRQSADPGIRNAHSISYGFPHGFLMFMLWRKEMLTA